MAAPPPDPAILSDAAARFGLDPAALEPLEGYISSVWAAGDAVLKIDRADAVEVRELRSEIAFVHHLAAGGVPVAVPLRSRAGAWAETVTGADGEAFVVRALERVRGHEPGPDDAGPELFRAMGRTLGRMHALARGYDPPPETRRDPWHALPHHRDWQRLVPEGDEAVRAALGTLFDDIHALPTGPDAWGTIHADFHSDNLVLRGGELVVIDFGDCLEGWYALDVAIALYYARRFLEDGHDAPAEVQRAFIAEFRTRFLEGYADEHPLPDAWRERLPLLLRWRQADLYLFVRSLAAEGELDADEREAERDLARALVAGRGPLEPPLPRT